MPARKDSGASPYFKSTPTRKSTRVSTASSSAKKRKQAASDSGSDFDNDEGSSGSDYGQRKSGKGSKRARRDDDYESASESDEDVAEEGDDYDSNDESKPMKRTVIPLPKMRDEGDISYEDGRLHSNTLLFLKDLKKNNNRTWMKTNDGEFRRAQKDFESFVTELTPLVAAKDFTIPELPSKDIIFRIYRDVRFSNDPTPYKPHFSVAWSRTGKKGPYAAYYFHLEPGNNSFIGGGLWHPEGPSLDLLRVDVDQNPQGLKSVLLGKNLKRDFFPGLKGKGGEKEVVAAFCDRNKENALKTKPRGYDTTHADIGILRLRNYTIGRKIPDAELAQENTLQMLANLIGSMEPFITYLNSVVRPDPRRNNANTAATAALAQQDDSSEDETGDNSEVEARHPTKFFAVPDTSEGQNR